MKPKTKKIALKLWIIIFIIGIIALTVYLAGYVQSQNNYQSQENCDEKYGEGNWSWIEVTGTKKTSQFYIGQVWQCQPTNETE